MSPRIDPDGSLAVVEDQADDADFELVSELPPRAALRCVGLDIVSPVGKMSTDSDQAQTGAQLAFTVRAGPLIANVDAGRVRQPPTSQ